MNLEFFIVLLIPMLFGERVILFRKEKIKIRLLICFEVTNVNILSRIFVWIFDEKIGLSNGKLTNRADSSRRSGEGGIDGAIRFVCHQRGRSGCRISRNELEPIKMPDIPQDFLHASPRFSTPLRARVACSRPSCPEK